MSFSNKKRGSYTYQAVEEKQPTFRQKFGDIHVVESNVNLLFRFVLGTLDYLSKKSVEEFGSIVKWATEMKDAKNTKSIAYFRNMLYKLCMEDAPENPRSAFYNAARISEEEDEEANESSNRDESKLKIRCGFLYQKNRVGPNIIEENDITLRDARPDEILHQIWFRINRLKFFMNRYPTKNDFDAEIEDKLNTLSEFFDMAWKDAHDYVTESLECQKRYYETHQTSETKPRRHSEYKKVSRKSEKSENKSTVTSIPVSKAAVTGNLNFKSALMASTNEDSHEESKDTQVTNNEEMKEETLLSNEDSKSSENDMITPVVHNETVINKLPQRQSRRKRNTVESTTTSDSLPWNSRNDTNNPELINVPIISQVDGKFETKNVLMTRETYESYTKANTVNL